MRTISPQLAQFAKKHIIPSTPLQTCIIYTRVSTLKQEKGYSLETQLKATKEFALQKGWEVSGFFGGKYESAASDERKEFNRMLEFCRKSKNKVGFILVYSLDRFSRTGANAIYIAEQLRHEAIHIMAVLNPHDTQNAEGVYIQNMQFVYSQYENELRRRKCVAGMKEKLLKGYRIGAAPLGYSYQKNGREQVIVQNEKAPLIKKAFEWKAEGVPQVEIRKRLHKLGMDIPKQSLSGLLMNPFYCGIISNSLLEGELIIGNHTPIISQQLFINANNPDKCLSKKARAMESPETPLKHHVRCGVCGTHFVGYQVKKKKKYYYKCQRPACSHISTLRLHDMFVDLLKPFKEKDGFVEAWKPTLIEIKSIGTENKGYIIRQLKMNLSTLENKLNQVEERFVYGEISKEWYDKYTSKLKVDKELVELELTKQEDGKDEVELFIKAVEAVFADVSFSWPLIGYEKQRILQKMYFPNGLIYNPITQTLHDADSLEKSSNENQPSE